MRLEAQPIAGSANMTARLTLICYASTDAVRRSAFPADEPLDDQGKASAAALANHLRPANRYWTSPEQRTRQTAEALQLNATVEPILRDCDYGIWIGRTFDEIWAQEPEAASRWLRDPEATPHGGESILSVMQRVAAWLDGQNGLSGQTIVVTHAAIIRAAIVHALEASPKSFWRIDIAPLSLTCISNNNGRWNLTSIGPIQSKRIRPSGQ
jgi:broad specificity phosphatase PhoE